MKKHLLIAAAASMTVATATPAFAQAQMVQVQDQFRLLTGVNGNGGTICEYSVFKVGEASPVTVINYKPSDSFYAECAKRASAPKATPRSVSQMELAKLSGVKAGGMPPAVAGLLAAGAVGGVVAAVASGKDAPVSP
ncbi:hypothetical protein [Sphingomicrobium astaxanthinifaciens]|uniref:hypothetical protein n=1 Tax=Sphingomicrobium astaxanthinifaciens TaxID=1227949 RepID=UPI001FCA6043|nr:hypothetical protein [Sphingomicrobium astaxanthinifaciens]MCJ7420423.1 hypothetical protein [Sphingomicrobium astaxanthinifaciens]